MERWNKMKEELEILNLKSLKGKSTLESAKVLIDIDSTNKRDDMFSIIKKLYNFSKKALDLARLSETTSGHDTSNLEDVIKKQLADVLPGLLKTALSNVPAFKTQAELGVKEDKKPSVRHTLTVTKKPEINEDHPPPITEKDWCDAVRTDLSSQMSRTE